MFTETAGTTTDDGTITDSGGFSLTGGKLFGNGIVAGAVHNSTGTITPGDSSTTTGVLTDKGAYTQSSTGTLNVSIGGTTAGTQFDALNSTTATLNGTLNVSLIKGFVPTIGQTFKIMNFTSETGVFAHCTCAIDSSEHFAIAYQARDVLLTVVTGGGGNFALPGITRQPTLFAGSTFSRGNASQFEQEICVLARPAVSDFAEASAGIPSAPIFFRNDLRRTSGSDSRAFSDASGMRANLGNAQFLCLFLLVRMRERLLLQPLSAWRLLVVRAPKPCSAIPLGPRE